jgi:hypothetical protein
MNALVLNLPIWGIIGLIVGIIAAAIANDGHSLAVGLTAFCIAMVVCLGICFGLTALGYAHTGQGTHVGYVTAVSDPSGLIFKTRGACVKTDNAQSQEDCYCVVDANLAGALRDMAEKKQRVEFHYQSYLIFGHGCEYSHSAIIDSFRAVG